MQRAKDGIQKIRQWFTGSISRKLTMFVVLICLIMILLVWILGVRLLEPAYNATMRAELDATLDTIVAVLDEAEAEGVNLVSLYVGDATFTFSLSSECINRLNEEITNGNLSIENLCIDMSTEEYGNIFLHDQLPSKCALHTGDGLLSGVSGSGGETVRRMRQHVLNGNELYQEDDIQMVMGKCAAAGKVSVIISANLERIPQAVGVLEKVMVIVSIALIAISILAAAIFSRWFTRPLKKLSDATREMGKGNYGVQVDIGGHDEIAQLGHDFNLMAEEVRCSISLQKDLIANISHDLRTPLTLIKGYAETIRDISGDDKAKRDDQLNVIVDESDRLSQLVGSVMELSRVSSGSEKPKPVDFNLAQLCEEVTYRYENLTEQNGYRLEYSGCDDCEVHADPALLERALHNLIGNAFNHIGADGYVGLRIFLTGDHTARVEVSDHGPGIAREDLPHIYERFYRSRSDQGKTGTGLGLSITKAIFDAHNFKYGVDSELGHGTTFWFEVPLIH